MPPAGVPVKVTSEALLVADWSGPAETAGIGFTVKVMEAEPEQPFWMTVYVRLFAPIFPEEGVKTPAELTPFPVHVPPGIDGVNVTFPEPAHAFWSGPKVGLGIEFTVKSTLAEFEHPFWVVVYVKV